MSDLLSVHTELAPRAIGPYSQAIVADGWVYCSGQIPVVPGTGALVEGDVADQTEQVLRNLGHVLESAGSSLQLVVKTTVFLADMRDFAAMNEVYARHFEAHKPARATIQVAGLPMSSAVEIECVARVRK